MSCAVVVLAAGGGTPPEALVEHEGSPLVERAVRTARAACDVVLVVLGAQAVDVWRTADLTGATVLADRDWKTGTASSLRTGLDGLRGFPGTVDAALITPVGLPCLTPEVLTAVAAHAAPGALAVATYGGVRAHPVLVGRDHWAGAAGDEGISRYLDARDVTEVDCTGPAELAPPSAGVPSAP